MSRARRHLALCAALWAAAPLACAGDSAAPVRDPFQRPALERMAAARPEPPAPPSPPALKAALRATVVAAEGSLANVGGHILRIGEALDGYRLVEVREREAVFEGHGRTQVLSLD